MCNFEYFYIVVYFFLLDIGDIDDIGVGDGGKGDEFGEEVFGGGGDVEVGDEVGEGDGEDDGGECGGDVC